MINTSVADQLSEDIRIICLVLTKPSNHFIKAVHIKSTWGKRCTKLVFASTQEEPVLPAIKLDIPEDRAHLWGKTKAALKHIYENYRGQYDWVYKADDDTFAVMENLRYLLHYSHPSEPVYYGCRLKLRREGLDYMSGGAGYALSREALRRFIEEGLPNAMACKQDDAGNEDVEMGKCLRGVGVYLGDSLDKERKNRFTPVFINEMLVPGVLSEVEWYMEMMTNPHLLGLKCCSDTLISTHYVKPHELYLLEYLIYHVTPFGRAYRPVLDDNILAKSTNEGPTGEVTGSSSQRRQRSDFD
ncbi:glycoprotein-N-acetylgalactosamine 3-beta-galactosyltransferase 1-like isoform X2 [Euwallacea fornicatus]